MNFLKTTFLTVLLVAFSLSTWAQEENVEEIALTAEEMNMLMYMDSVEKAMAYDTSGSVIALKGDIADIVVPQGFKYLNPEQSKYILTEVWGNPNGETLGMLFKNDAGIFFDDSYAINITYDESGYISDENANDMDYNELMEEMKASTAEENEARKEAGYGTMDIIGWASEPYYDPATKKLHWAKELFFEGSDANTLNYNLMVLGRKGYLELNFISDIQQLDMVKNDIPAIIPNVNFKDGYRYDQFDASIDKVAAYGIGGLIAGKILAKTGFFAILAKFGKVIFLGLAAIGGGIVKFFRGNKQEKENA
ncbi:DUF2167 domain-containing protein [Algivirga pacifica]|uniref:DUF2167 domain-containing protein n=1 Tax=Algivirga pacifica TaxID=1162670 RepID=A0ABP9CZA1_9BACT